MAQNLRLATDLGHTVLVGARDPRRGTQAAHELGGVYLDIDPTDENSVHAASRASAMTRPSPAVLRAIGGR